MEFREWLLFAGIFTINCFYAQSLTFNITNGATHFKVGHDLSTIYPIFKGSSTLCVVSKSCDDLLYFLQEQNNHNLWFAAIVFDDWTNLSLDFCDKVVILNFDVGANWEKVLENISRQPVYFINSHSYSGIASLEHLLQKTSTPDVVYIYLMQSLVYELSSIFQRPRHFTKSSIANIIMQQEKPNKLNLKGTVLKAVATLYIPFFGTKEFLKNYKHKTLSSNVWRKMNEHPIYVTPEETIGIEDAIIKELAMQLNFTLMYQVFGNMGKTDSNGSFVNGMGKAIFQGDFDLAIGHFWHSQVLHAAMDFGPSLSYNRLVFMVRRPKLINIHFGVIISIFKIEVWIYLLLAYGLVVIVFWALSAVNIKIHANFKKRQSSLLDIMITLFGHGLMTSSHNPEKTTMSRFVLTFWSIFSLLISTALSTLIVTKFTLPHYTSRIDSVQQLVEKDYYWTSQFYKNVKDNHKITHTLFDFDNEWQVKFERTYKYLEADEVRKRTKFDEKLTFLAQIFKINVVIVNSHGVVDSGYLSKYRLTKEAMKQCHVSIGIRKHSHLFDAVTLMNQRILETGILDNWVNKMLIKINKFKTSELLIEQDTQTFKEHQVLEIGHLQSEFYMLLTGLAISFLIFFTECLDEY